MRSKPEKETQWDQSRTMTENFATNSIGITSAAVRCLFLWWMTAYKKVSSRSELGVVILFILKCLFLPGTSILSYCLPLMICFLRECRLAGFQLRSIIEVKERLVSFLIKIRSEYIFIGGGLVSRFDSFSLSKILRACKRNRWIVIWPALLPWW